MKRCPFIIKPRRMRMGIGFYKRDPRAKTGKIRFDNIKITSAEIRTRDDLTVRQRKFAPKENFRYVFCAPRYYVRIIIN